MPIPSLPDPHKIRDSLERVLASPAFRNSKQCQKFLRYVVEHSLHGADEMLRERLIGVEVFGRDAAYDTAEDPVVRVRATEVRKRLAQYYQDSGAREEFRLDIPAGSYRVEVHALERPPQPAAPVETRRRWPVAVVTVAFLVAAGWGAYRLTRPVPAVTTLDRFWAPVIGNPKPVLIYCGQPVVYFLSREVHARYRPGVPPDQRRTSYAVRLEPDAVLRGRDIIPVTDQFVGIGNAHTAALLSALFAGRGKPVEIRYANDVSFSDLRSAPSVLIGAFSNPWTIEMTESLRFVFETEESGRSIRDRQGGKVWRLTGQAPDGKTPEDYAVVSRVFNSASGQTVIAAAGISQYGTRAAGEFLTDNARLEQALQQAPPDWPKKNMQALLHTQVYKGTPAPPEVLAVHFW